MHIHNVEQLNVYKRAFALTIDLYKITEKFPKSEMFGLVSQIRRAAISINSNVMEGGARNSVGEFKQFIGVARGSVSELKFQIKVSKELNFIKDEDCNHMINNLEVISKMLTGLLDSLK